MPRMCPSCYTTIYDDPPTAEWLPPHEPDPFWDVGGAAKSYEKVWEWIWDQGSNQKPHNRIPLSQYNPSWEREPRTSAMGWLARCSPKVREAFERLYRKGLV